MNDNTNIPVQEPDLQIDLVDMCYNILRKWRFLLLICVVGIALGIALGSFGTNTIDQYDPYLPGHEVELLEIEKLAHLYGEYTREAKQDANDYILSLDPSSEYYTGKISFYIRAKSPEDIGLLTEVLNFTNNTTYLNDIQDILQFNGDPLTLSPVIQYSTNQKNESIDNIMYIIDSETQNLSFCVLNYIVNYVDEEQCNQIIDYIASQMTTMHEAYQKQVNSFELVKINQSINKDTQHRVSVMQRAIAQRLLDKYNAYLNQVKELKANTNYSNADSILHYFSSNYLPIEEQKSPDVSNNSSILKTSIITALALALISVIAICALYLLSGSIHSIEELAGMYGYNIIGIIYMDEKKRKTKIDKFIDNAFSKGEFGNRCSVNFIAAALDKIGNDPICICNTSNTNKLNLLNSQLYTLSKKRTVTGMVHNSMEILDLGSESGGLFLTVELGATKYREMRNTINICKSHSLKISGIIVVDNA